MPDKFLSRIAEDLRRQREDLEKDMIERTQSQGTTAELLERIEKLRKRSEVTQPPSAKGDKAKK